MAKRTPHNQRADEAATQLTDQERALDRLRRGVPVEQLAGELGVTAARARELADSILAKRNAAKRIERERKRAKRGRGVRR